MRYSFILVLLISPPCWTQTATTGQATTNAPCSVANTGSDNKIQITCGIGKEQGQKMLAILNRILEDHLDPSAVMTKLDDIRMGVEDMRQQGKTSGLLSPGNEPTPENPCGSIMPAGGTLVLLGNSASFATTFPSTIIKIGNDETLGMEKIEGRIAISATLYSSDGRIVAQLDKNQFFINPNNFFRKEISSDGHSLVVFDQTGVEVLNVKFINPTTVAFLGVIRHPSRTIEISKIRGVFANTMCSADNRGAAYHF